MQNKQIAFIAYQDQDNLGVGYMASMLLDRGFRVASIDIQLGDDVVAAHARALDPVAIGVSIIFQHQIRQFRDLIRKLRTVIPTCHLCAGGHYPSLRYAELLDFIPELDSVGLFEGEYTFLELCEALRDGKNWRDIPGLAFRQDGLVTNTPLRPLVADLDTLPVPVRRAERRSTLGQRAATLLASRGCVYNCSFCSIRQFYSTPPGPVKRVRKPECVVAEMKYLHSEFGCSIFIFQDDDFPLSGRQGRQWVSEFCNRLAAERLDQSVLWKASCRPNEVDYELFRKLTDHGLGWVYLGIEAGTDAGLKLMNKHLSKDTGPKAVGTLKQLGLAYAYGFMPFDPSSTFDSVSENFDFLDELCSDGSAPVTFCKMLPYVGTAIENQLRQAGRLLGEVGYLDYRFNDSALDRYYSFLTRCFGPWMHDPDGVSLLGQDTIVNLVICRKFCSADPELDFIVRTVANTLAESNRFFLRTARDLMPWFRKSSSYDYSSELNVVADSVAAAEIQYRSALRNAMNSVEELAGRVVTST